MVVHTRIYLTLWAAFKTQQIMPAAKSKRPISSRYTSPVGLNSMAQIPAMAHSHAATVREMAGEVREGFMT